jgi:hypothetical protein
MVCWQEKAKTADHAGGCVFFPLLLCRSGFVTWLCVVVLLGLQVTVGT